MFFFTEHHCLRWFFNGFATTGPSPMNVFFPILTIDIDGFSMVFPKFRYDGRRWFWPIKETKKARIHKILHSIKTQEYNRKARRGRNAFTSTELRIVHDFTVGCLTFARILLPLQSVNDFLWHHHHWIEWFRPTIEINGFLMVLGSDNHWQRWFSVVVHHWSNDGMAVEV